MKDQPLRFAVGPFENECACETFYLGCVAQGPASAFFVSVKGLLEGGVEVRFLHHIDSP